MLLSIIEQAHTPLTFKAIAKILNYQEDYQLVGIKRRLRAMENEGQIIFNKFKQYAITPKSNLITGKVIGHRDGFGFFEPDVPAGGKKGKDFYISSHEMQRVIHGDIVEAILVDRTDRKGRQEIKIIGVIEPRKAGIVGRFYVEHNIAFVVPDDARIKQDILINPDEKMGARHGQMVVVEVIQRPSKRANAVGKVIEVLGEHMAPGMEIQIALREHDLPYQWSHEVEQEVALIPDEVEEKVKSQRKDLRQLPLVTIDGEDARDFDDAVYCQPIESGGWRLWVAIADVSYYVRPNTALDDEAIARGNSVYFPSQVIPMLPEKLSNGLCSLNPDVDRLCMVCEMEVSASGKLIDSQFYPSVMRSKARFTYTKVAAILEGDEELRKEYQPLVADLENLYQMYLALTTSRVERGAIAFETEESIFIFNADRKIESIEPLIRNDAHKIIEECMVLANVATAEFVEKHNVAGLFRVHDKPSEEKFANFVTYLSELGLQMPKSDSEDGLPEPRDYSNILAKIAGRPDQELIQTMLLRSMRQAVYQSDNVGHFGLALNSYSHFTSPIRRYPDLVIHRVIKAVLEQQESSDANQGFYQYPQEAVVELGEHCSMTERRADDATRDVSDWLKCEFMQDHVGDTFTGVISTVTNFGLFVRLSKLHIEGLIHITSLGHDYYHYDDVRMSLSGEKTGAIYRVGDVLEVQVAAVNLDEKKIDLVLSGDNAVISRAKPLPRNDSGESRKSLRKNSDRNSRNGKPVRGRASNKNSPEFKGTTKKASVKKNKPKKAKPKKASASKKRPGKNARKNKAK
ncbi:ribonuclease R [Thalassotalea profundi]|uniref:Ribonuclease R n=1 Tax=Thalassotalea profundi TaxID=2036687 RepID=A0ABQ3IZU0_9GAMM|nr:ribonuclease R [Thalassotalea profundi]